jgi:eukaryotic-like serine/threonine-protein kinase
VSAGEDTEVAGRYLLDERIGSGGAGAVWRGRDAVLGRPVAIKEVRVAADDPNRNRDRVLREARAAARLHHPRVTGVYDVIEDAETVRIVMELVEGPSLAERVREAGPLSAGEAAQLGLDVLDALEAAHARGIVHRDVKPGNVLLASSGPKLTDFGIASVDDDTSLTVAGTVLGSPSFMSPEQAQGREAGPASDLWGLGALLHFAVEGSPPFDRNEPLPTLAAVVGEPHPPAEHAGPLAPVIDALLRKDPADRPAAAGLRAMLRTAVDESADGAGGDPAADRTAAVRTAAVDAAPPPRPASPADEEPPDAPRSAAAPAPDRRRRLVLLLAGVLALLLVGGALWALDGGEDAPAETPGAPVEIGADDGTDPEEAEDEGGTDDPPPTAEDPGADDDTADDTADAAELPEGWTRSGIGPAGASVGHPADWEEVVVSETIVDHRAGGATYLRTDWTDEPAGDPVEDWQRQSEAFGSSRDGYEELRIEPMTVDGHDGAIWEYTYAEGGTQLRAINVAIVAGSEAYALNIQTTAAEWGDLQPTIDEILASFSSS